MQRLPGGYHLYSLQWHNEVSHCASHQTVCYCSDTCAQLHWGVSHLPYASVVGSLNCSTLQIHEQDCRKATAFNKSCQEANSREPPGNQLNLPRLVSFVHLMECFKDWTNAHGMLFKWMCFQALRVPHDTTSIQTRFVYLAVEPRWDGGSLMRRAFRVKSIQICAMNALGRLVNPEYVTNAVDAQVGSERQQAPVATFVIHCLPFRPHVKREIIHSDFILRTLHHHDWYNMMIKDIEEGSVTSPLVDPWARVRFTA